MTIRLVEEDERLEFRSEGATLYYRRPSQSKQGFFARKNTKRQTGITDWVAVTKDLLNYCILDWEGVVGRDDEVVSFDKSLVEKLPADLVSEFINEIGIANPERAAEKKD